MSMEKNSIPLTNRFSSRIVLFFVTLIGLLIANELIFWWARQHGISENNSYDITSLVEAPPSGSGKRLALIKAMTFDSKDNLWIAREDRIIVLGTDGKSKTHLCGIGGVASLAVDSSDQVWIWNNAGLQRLNQNGTWASEAILTFYGKEEAALAADHQGRLWVVTDGQLSQLFEGEWTNHYRLFSNRNISGYCI